WLAVAVLTFGVFRIDALFQLPNNALFSDELVLFSISVVGALVLYFFRYMLLQIVARQYDESLAVPAFLNFREKNAKVTTRPLVTLRSWRRYWLSGGPFIFLDFALASIVYPIALYVIHPMYGIVLGLGSLSILIIVVLNVVWLRTSVPSWESTSSINDSIEQQIADTRFPIHMMQILNNLVARWVPTQHVETHGSLGIARFHAATSSYIQIGMVLVLTGFLGVTELHIDQLDKMVVALVFSALMFGVFERTNSLLLTRNQGIRAGRVLRSTGKKARKKEPKPLVPVGIGFSGYISMQGVDILHPTQDRLLVEGLNVEMRSSTITGFVGPNLCGKSLIAQTVANTWSHFQGEFKLDRELISVWNPLWVNSNIGYLPQHVELLSGTIAENVCRFERAIHEEKIEEALVRAGINDQVAALDLGMHTPVFDPSGIVLGQSLVQQIGMARALYRSPQIMVLDEPLAGLDSYNISRMLDTIRGLRRGGKTVILFFSSSSLLDVCDKLVLLQEGRVLLSGDTNEVLQELQPQDGAVTRGLY
nr:ATP-binding cassette domain-containing protein [Alphaproteobacteria bacterium]